MTVDYGEGIVRRFWEEIFGRGDIEAMDEVLSPDYKLHDLVYQEVHHLREVRRIVGDIHNEVPGTQVIVEDQRLDEEGRVFTRFTLRVSPPQDAETSWQTTPPGEEWEYSGLSLSRVVDGKIEESWMVWEALRAAEELETIFGLNFWRWPPWR